MEDILLHYGVKFRSGRYPWGSGDKPYQHSGDFLSRYEELKDRGLSEKDIVKELEMDSTTDLRLYVKIAKHERRDIQRATALSLKEDGLNTSEIARRMGFANESSVRALLNENTAVNKNKAKATADILKEQLKTKGMIDVGVGAEQELGISRPQLDEALAILASPTEGYQVFGVGVATVNNKAHRTTHMVLANPDISQAYAYNHLDEIKPVSEYHSDDGGFTFKKVQYPASIDGSRVDIRYGDQGGLAKDGVIELRRGVADLNLGSSNYAQVRILVDGTHYLKGMAMYSDDMPDGVDIVFNTNKKSGTPKEKVLKEITKDPENPFGAALMAKGQSTYIDINGEEKLSAINKLKEEGDWDSMSKNLSSQFLSKQPHKLISQQLDLTYKDYVDQFEEIKAYSNPTIKKQLLMEFANSCEGATVSLKASAFPGQKTQVILPLDKMPETEVFAPNWPDGTRVALIRYPHAGTFEIPELVVNNKNKSALDILGPNVKDAVGIHPSVAEKLSGADFDGDQVVVIPLSDKVRVKSTPSLKALEGFDPKAEYPYTEGMRVMRKSDKQKEMGMVSNLITDMTLRGAPESDIAKAVKHSMVVIDAEKHKLDYKRSEVENDIQTLRQRWQYRYDEDGNLKTGGASTLISRRKQTVNVDERQGSGWIDKETGEVHYRESGRTYIDNSGKVVKAQTKVNLIQNTPDARTLISGHPTELLYAEHINKLKALANEARKEYVTTGNLKYNPSARERYSEEYNHLMAQLNIAEKNIPREREAQRVANMAIRAKVQDNPGLTKDDISRIRQEAKDAAKAQDSTLTRSQLKAIGDAAAAKAQADNPGYSKKELKKLSAIAINNARADVHSSGRDSRIKISDREWEAIQAGALTENQLTKVLRFTDKKEVQRLAMPRATTTLSPARVSKIKAMKNSGYTNAQIAEALGVSTSTIHNYLN